MHRPAVIVVQQFGRQAGQFVVGQSAVQPQQADPADQLTPLGGQLAAAVAEKVALQLEIEGVAQQAGRADQGLLLGVVLQRGPEAGVAPLAIGLDLRQHPGQHVHLGSGLAAVQAGGQGLVVHPPHGEHGRRLTPRPALGGPAHEAGLQLAPPRRAGHDLVQAIEQQPHAGGV